MAKKHQGKLQSLRCKAIALCVFFLELSGDCSRCIGHRIGNWFNDLAYYLYDWADELK